MSSHFQCSHCGKMFYCLFFRALLSGILCCSDPQPDGGTIDHQRPWQVLLIWLQSEQHFDSNVKIPHNTRSQYKPFATTSTIKLLKNKFILAQWQSIQIFGYGGNEEAYQAPTSTRPLGLTRSVPGSSGYQAQDYKEPDCWKQFREPIRRLSASFRFPLRMKRKVH